MINNFVVYYFLLFLIAVSQTYISLRFDLLKLCLIMNMRGENNYIKLRPGRILAR